MARARVVSLPARVFEIKHVVAELPEAFHKLQIIPRHAAEGILRDQAGNDDSHLIFLYPTQSHNKSI